MRYGVDDQPREDAPSEATQPWASTLRVREPVAWTLLVLTAIGMLVTAGQLLGIVGAPIPVATPVPVTSSGSVVVATFALRASAVGPQFVDFGFVVMAVLSVVLVAFAGGLTDRARQVGQTALSIQAVGLALGVVTWLAALGAHSRPGPWFIFFAVDLAVAATALTFIAAVMRSPALQLPTPRYQDVAAEDDEDFGDDDEDIGGDEVHFGPPSGSWRITGCPYGIVSCSWPSRTSRLCRCQQVLTAVR
jgi:hypothetical protein